MKTASEHAQVAKEIKKYFKSLSIPCKTKSTSYAGGSSVTIWIKNIHPEKLKEYTEYCEQYERGSFNCMNDMYELTNIREDIPQVKFVFLEHKYTPEFYQNAYDIIATNNPSFQNKSINDLNSEEIRLLKDIVLGESHIDIHNKIWNILGNKGA